MMMLGLKSGPQIGAKTGNPAGLLFRRIWYSVWKSGVLGITEYRQGRPLISLTLDASQSRDHHRKIISICRGVQLCLEIRQITQRDNLPCLLCHMNGQELLVCFQPQQVGCYHCICRLQFPLTWQVFIDKLRNIILRYIRQNIFWFFKYTLSFRINT